MIPHGQSAATWEVTTPLANCAPVIRACIALLFLAVQAAPASAQGELPWPRDPAAVSATCANVATELRARVTAIAARNGEYSFANTVLALENAVADARDRVAAERFVWAVAQDDALVSASRECRTLLKITEIDAFANPSLYGAVARVANRLPHSTFDRALTLAWVDRLKAGGGALYGSRRDRYVSFARELLGVEDAFWRNLAHARATIRIDRGQARDLPPDLLSAFARNRDGSFVVPVDAGTRAFLRYESDADARKAFYRAYNQRAAEVNVSLLERAISLRDRMAHALGIESWAEFRLRSTPLGGYAQAAQFLTAASTAYASGRPPAGTAPWDLEREQGDSVVPARSLDDALDSIGIAFGLHFTPNSEGAWASGVARYDVSEESSQRSVGTLYVDLARRSGKQTGEDAYAILPPRATRSAVVAIVASWPGRSGTIEDARLVDFYRLAGRAVALLSPSVPYETLARVSPACQQTIAAIFERFERPEAPSARDMLKQTTVAQIDLTYSSSGSHVDTSAVWQSAAAATFTPLYDKGTYPQAASDAFAGGDAGLLVLRPWGQTYAADLYGSLATDGRFNPKAGERFRHTILAPGATRTFEDEMRDFLGHDPHSVMP
jgi:Zn-dependent oligopeptidase